MKAQNNLGWKGLLEITGLSPLLRAVPASKLDCTSKLGDFAWGHSYIFPREESGPQVHVQHMLHYLSLCHL